MANETELIDSLTWGKTKKSLTRLLKQYQLPLIVRVVDSVQRTNGEACVHDGQVLVLHEIDSKRELIATDNLGRKITIPLSCPTQGLVQPSKCKYTSCRAEDFKAIFPKVQFVRVKSVDSQTGNDDETPLKVGDLLQIKKIERKKKTVLCQKTDTDRYIIISYTSPVIFTPLLDYRKYKLSEIVSNYGLPAKVCFETTRSQVNENSEQAKGSLTGLNEFVFHKEVGEAQLMATDIARKDETTQCIGLPTDLPIQCVVAKRTAENEASYNNVIESLQAEFNEKNTTKRVSLFQDVHGVKLYDFTSLERPEQSNAAKSSPPVSPIEHGKKLTESNIVARTPPRVTPTTRKRSKQPSNVAATPTSIPPTTKKRFEDSEPSLSPRGILQISSDDSTTEAEESDDLSSTEDDDYIAMGGVENVYEDVDGEKDNSLNTCYLSLTGQSSTEKATSTRSDMNSNYTYCYAEVKPRWNLNLNQKSEYCYAEVNPTRKWNYKPELRKSESKILKEEINGKRPSGYEEIKPTCEFSFNQEFVNPKSIVNQNERPLSSESIGYVIPLVRLENSTGRKFKVCKQNPSENACKHHYENVFMDKIESSNSGKFEKHGKPDTIHGECSDDDEYVEVDNPYQNIEKRQKNTLLKSLSNEEMESSMETAKTQLKDEDQQHTVGRQVRFL